MRQKRPIGSTQEKSLAGVVLPSPLFDEVAYASAAGVSGTRQELIDHYLAEGETKGIAPSAAFDPVFYSLCNPDVAEAGVNRLLHYISFGKAEGRFANKDEVRKAAKIITKEHFFNPVYYREHDEVLVPDLEPVEEQLALWRLGKNPNPAFDSRFYAALYPDVQTSGKAPLLHYLETGRAEKRLTNSADYEYVYKIAEKKIDRRFYLSQLPGAPADLDLTRHYLTIGVYNGINPSPDFSHEYYLRRYPDIASSGSLPALHYWQNGKGEGRVGLVNFSESVEQGLLPYDDSKPTLIISNHEASRTGAPLVGLNLARKFSEKYNIITHLGHVRHIKDAFLECSTAVTVGFPDALDGEYLLKYLREKYGAQVLLTNSVETSIMAYAATWAGMPIVALVHEFAEYTLPASRVAELVRLADSVIVPAKLVEASLQKDVYFFCSAEAPNVEIRPQGVLPWLPAAGKGETDIEQDDIVAYVRNRAPHKNRIILGAGHVGIRKGVDIFVQIAAEVRKIRDDVAFIWVGDGYYPNHDMAYSLWVQEMVKRMGLEDTVFFLPPQSSLDAFYAVSDMFVLTSRLDPFPNVVVDAMLHDKYVVCFEGATGCAEMFATGRAQGAAVAHCDAAAAAQAITYAIDNPAPAGVNAQVVKDLFDFDAYADFIEGKLNEAIVQRARIEESIPEILACPIFDSLGYRSHALAGSSALQIARDYAVGSAKGLARRNPGHGFSENAYYTKNPVEPGVPALVAAMRRAEGEAAKVATHLSIEIGKSHQNVTGASKPGRVSSGKVSNGALKTLLHVHAHYPDEVSDVITRLNQAKISLDIIATTTSSANVGLVEYLLSKFEYGKVTTRLVKNLGRDVGPFLTEIPAIARDGNYEIVGHVHTKKSLAWNAADGSVWKDYLLDTLLGNGTSVLPDILDLFRTHADLGLVFPEDGNNIGWSSNMECARMLAGRFEGGLDLPARPVFPVGDMFWARRQALEPLWNLNLGHADFPPEPVPYDGSILHAIERLTPSICEKAGYRWATVYVDGVKR